MQEFKRNWPSSSGEKDENVESLQKDGSRRVIDDMIGGGGGWTSPLRDILPFEINNENDVLFIFFICTKFDNLSSCSVACNLWVAGSNLAPALLFWVNVMKSFTGLKLNFINLGCIQILVSFSSL